MLAHDLGHPLVPSRTLLRDLSASVVGLVLGFAASGLVGLGAMGGAPMPEPTATVRARPSDPIAVASTRIAELEALNAQFAAALVRLSGADRSVLPPPEIAGPENPLS